MAQQETETQKGRVWPWVLASILALLLLPTAAVLGIISMDSAAHEAAFEGICGPYAPDIEAYSCDKETYMEHFPPPFAAIAYMMQWAGYTAALLFVELLVWGGWLIRRRMQRKAAAG